jgi:hypothetical protein
MKKLLITLASVGLAVTGMINAADHTFRIVPSSDTVFFALYDTNTNKRVDGIKVMSSMKGDGSKHGFKVDRERAVIISPDGSMTIVISRYRNFPKNLSSDMQALVIDRNASEYIKACLNPSRSAVSRIESFDSRDEAMATCDDALVNPRNTETYMESINRKNRSLGRDAYAQ